MYSSAFAYALKNLGGGFRTRKPGSIAMSGSAANREDAAESMAPLIDPVLLVDNAGKIDGAVDVADGPDWQAPKRRKVVGVKPPKTKEPTMEKVVCDEAGKDRDGEPVRIGNFSLEQLATTMSKIPNDEDWTSIEESGLSAVLKRLTGHWGYVSFFTPLSPELFHSFTCEFSFFLLTVSPGLF